MLSTRELGFHFRFLFLFVVFSTFFSLIHGVIVVNHLQTTRFSEVKDENKYVVDTWGGARSVLEGSNAGNSSLILAADRTHRRDPLDYPNYYNGGWNISNDHYISSVAYTAGPLFLIAFIWFVVFGIFLLLSCLCWCCCCRHRQYGYSRTAYALSLIFLSLFTVAAIVGSVVLYTGQGKFRASTGDTLDYVLKQADATVGDLNNVSSYLASAKRVGVNQVFLPQNVQNSIDRVESELKSAADTLETETKKNKKDILYVLDGVRTTLVIVAAVMLLLALLGFLLSILGLQCVVYILVVIGWILVALTFILCGVFLFLHNLTGDTCVAMDEWVKNPAAHTALDDIIPCVDTATAQDALSQSKDVTSQLIQVVNAAITNVSNVNLPPGTPRPRPLFYNQSGPLVPVLCNPYNPDRTNRTCAVGEVDLSNAMQVWRNYVCQVSENNTCTTVGRLTPTMYDQMTGVVNVSYGLYHYGPFLSDLLDCTFLRGTFTVIHDDHCPDLRLYSKWVYIGLALVSAAVMLSLIFWVLYARERRHRKYTRLIDSTSRQASLEGKGHP